MASLKKPAKCSECGHDQFEHLYKPERWVCKQCNHVESERPRRDNTKCRKCSAPRGSKPFKKGKNICQECENEYAKNWRKDNESYREYRKDLMVRLRLQGNVQRSIEKCPEHFLRYLLGSIKRSARNKAGSTGHKAAIGVVEIDFDYLMDLWKSQDGLCALTGLKMVHQFGDLCSISVDRIDSDVGYVPGNVHLVCQWANHAKRHHPVEKLREVLDTYYRLRREIDAGVPDYKITRR